MLRIGASSWTAPGWQKVFYPPKCASRDQITFYSTQFDTVEIDATFYAIPAASTVTAWRNRTPERFLFAAKVPQVITHEKLLQNCEPELDQFCQTMSLLEERLGPILFQFRYFRKGEMECDDFVAKLEPVINRVPREIKVAVEVRNKSFLEPSLTEALKRRGAALTLVDHPYMPTASWYAANLDRLITSDFCYIRFLGDRLKTEEIIAKQLGDVTFERSVIDRSHELSAWQKVVEKLLEKKISVYAYFNNHYSGYAPNDMTRFRQMLLD